MKFSLKSFIILFVTVIVIVLIRSNNEDEPEWHQHSLIGLHTHIEITWKDPLKKHSILKRKIDSLVTYFDNLFTESDSGHPLNILGKSPAQQPLILSGDVKKVFDYLTLQKQNHPHFQEFNLASAEWLIKWGLLEYPHVKSNYTDEGLKRLLQDTVFDYNQATGSLALRVDSLHLTMGAVTKGYGLNKLTELMLMNGIQNFLINAGGDLSFLGNNKSGGPWRIGVRHPRQPDNIQAILTPGGPQFKGLATSGDYETFRLEEGKRIHHLINALTGQPVSDKQSVTVLAGDPMQADYYATCLFLLPLPKLLDFVNQNPELEVMVTDSAGGIHFSNNMEKFIKAD